MVHKMEFTQEFSIVNILQSSHKGHSGFLIPCRWRIIRIPIKIWPKILLHLQYFYITIFQYFSKLLRGIILTDISSHCSGNWPFIVFGILKIIFPLLHFLMLVNLTSWIIRVSLCPLPLVLWSYTLTASLQPSIYWPVVPFYIPISLWFKLFNYSPLSFTLKESKYLTTFLFSSCSNRLHPCFSSSKHLHMYHIMLWCFL